MHKVTVSDAGVDVLEDLSPVDLRWDYSGRAMYGDRCLALVGNLDDLVSFALALGRECEVVGADHEGELEDVVELVRRNTYSDNLGLDTVYYWPGVTRS